MPGATKSENAQTDIQTDPKAREILKRASEKTYRWPLDFKGFSADLIIEEAGKVCKGRVEIKSARDVSVTLDDASLQEWASGTIGMIAVHRSPRSFEEGDGRYALTLGPEDHHPFGRKVHIHGDGLNSSYRVKDDRIFQVNRRGERMCFTINVEDALSTPDHRHLTTRYTVYYFSPKDGQLSNVESYTDTPAVIDGAYLPGTRLLNMVKDQAVVTRRLEFLNHRWL